MPRSLRNPAVIYLLLFTLALINYLDRVALSIAAGPISKEFGFTPVQMGYLFSSFLWTYLLFVIPCGILADRFGAKRVNAGGITVWSLATIATGLANGFVMLFGTRLVMGAGEATSYPAANRFIREHVPTRNRGFATAIFNSGSYAGPALGAIIITWLVLWFGWRMAFVAAGAIGFVWLGAWLAWYRRFERDAPARAAAPDIADAPAPEVSRGQPIGMRGLLRATSMWGIALTQGCAVYTQYLFLTWLPSYLQATKGLDLKQAGVFTAVPYAGAVLLGIAIGKLSDRMLTEEGLKSGKRRRIVGVSMLASSVILLTPLVDNVWLIVLLFTLSLTGISTAVSLNMALANDLLSHAGDAGRANSIAVVGGNVFGIMAPIVTGYVISATGSYSYAFVTAGVLLVCGAAFSQLLTRSPIGARA